MNTLDYERLVAATGQKPLNCAEFSISGTLILTGMSEGINIDLGSSTLPAGVTFGDITATAKFVDETGSTEINTYTLSLDVNGLASLHPTEVQEIHDYSDLNPGITISTTITVTYQTCESIGFCDGTALNYEDYFISLNQNEQSILPV